MARIITVTSGKGGVGKTSISLNLSLALASQGLKVCLLDADLGLANVNILTGIYPKKTLESVISGLCTLDEIIIKNFQGVDIIPGASGVEKLADLTRTQAGTLISSFLDSDEYDYFIFDTSAGISSRVLSFCMASHEIVLIATCEPTSLTDAYSLLKVLSRHGYKNPVKVIINQVKKAGTAQKAYSQLKGTAKKFLNLKIQPLGVIATDKNVRAAVVSQIPFFMLFPDTIASKCIESVAYKIIQTHGQHRDMPLELFWDQCLSFLKKHQKTAAKTRPVVQKKKTREKTPPARPQDKKTADIQDTLSRMQSTLDTLVKAMSDIKQLLKSRDTQPKTDTGTRLSPEIQMKISNNISKRTENTSKPREDKPHHPPEPRKVPLDFESWLERHPFSVQS